MTQKTRSAYRNFQ